MTRLGKNRGGYFGETIDIRVLLRDVEAAARQYHWAIETFHESDDFKWFAFHRPAKTPGGNIGANHRLYISTGIHGDEPAGPPTALKLLRENLWPDNLEITLLPCLNPVGFVANRRENRGGIDLNRDYRNSRSAEIRAHIGWLEKQPRYDLYLCLHEDWESHGFYLYEQNPDQKPSPADAIIEQVGKVCPIDLSAEIEDRPATNGIIRPNIRPQERPDWPEALYLISHKSRQGYTLEAPSDFPLETRIAALATATRTAIDFFART
jgi:hypothetical protein